MMQIEHLFANTLKKRRPSYGSVSNASSATNETLLSTRTPKSISKSRRSSLVADVLGGNGSLTSGSNMSTTNYYGGGMNGVCVEGRRSSLVNVVFNGLPSSSSPSSSLLSSNSSALSLSPSIESNYTFPPTEPMECTMMEGVEPTTITTVNSTPFLDHHHHHDQRLQQQQTQGFNSFSSSFSSFISAGPTLSSPTFTIPRLATSLSATSSTLSPDSSASSSSSSSRPRSSSITSMTNATMNLSTQSMNLPSFDIHTMYKIKKRRSSSGDVDQHYRQLQSSHLQKDISIHTIRNEGLNGMLASKVPLCYFLYHLLEEYSSENLFFYLEIEQYDTMDYVSTVQQLATAQHIYDVYLSRNSQFEVNLDDKVRSDVIVALQARNVNACFQTAKRAVYLLLESSFMQFVRTETWLQMEKNCGEFAANYDTETRDKAVNNLIGYLERMHSIIYTNPHTDTPMFMNVNQSTRKHYDMVKAMVHEFCRTLLGVEFDYYRACPSDDFASSSSTPPSPTSSLPGQSSHSSHQPQQRRGLKHRHVVLFDFFGKRRP